MLLVLTVAVVLVLGAVAAIWAGWRTWGYGPKFTATAVLTGLVLGALETGLFVWQSTDVDPSLYAAATLGGACFLAGLVLWIGNHARPEGHHETRHANLTNLAVSLMTGGAVALLLFALQNAQETRLQNLQATELKEQRRADFQLAVALESDLTGFSPPRHADTGNPLGEAYSMANMYLNGKKLANAGLTDVDLSAARLQFAHLGSSTLLRARFDGARMRGAYLHYADLRCACLRDAVLIDADLSNTDLRGADLRGANLSRADLRGAVTDDETLWPREALRAGACQEKGNRGCGEEARNTWAEEDEDPEKVHSFSLRSPDNLDPRNCDPVGRGAA